MPQLKRHPYRRTLLFGVALVWLTAPTVAQSDPPPIWKGVFSEAQAERGRAVVDTHCIRCHGLNRPLSGDPFMLHWEGHTVARLWRRIKETMPANQVSTVSDRDKLDALAFVLQLNGFPAGSDVSEDMAALSALQILPREGPRPMRTGMAAEVIGCLSKGTGSSWQVTNATEPAPTAMDLFESDLKAAVAAPLETLTFQLLYPSASAEPHTGKKVHIKGLLIRRPAGDRLNVIALEPLASNCGQG